jgi:two-component system cell cycle sensor histidine kinase/response regulator CckA
MILLVEDEQSVRAIAARVLRGSGHNGIEVIDGEDALRVAAAHSGSLSLVLTSLVMPRRGGVALAARIRGRRLELPARFSSGYSWDAQAIEIQDAASLRLLRKPFTPRELSRFVRTALDPAPPG